jgi:putative lipoprotein
VTGSVPTREVRGTVRFRETVPAPATVHVHLDEVSRADAAATPVAELILPLTASLPAGAELPFAILAPAIEERERYAVRVHVDVSGTGEVEVGDLLSTSAYPVLTHGAPDDVAVEAHLI